MTTGDLEPNLLADLVTHAESVALTLRYGDVNVEVTPDSVIFRDPDATGDDILTSFSHENFDDIVLAYRVMTERGGE